MNQEQKDVINFMVKAGQSCPVRPAIPSLEVRMLRVKLIAEELAELANALGIYLIIDTAVIGSIMVCGKDETECDLAAAADATTDLKVVVIGTDVAMGIDNEPIWNEVHRTNMAKFGPGGYRREDGKWMKPPVWTPPNIKSIIDKQSD